MTLLLGRLAARFTALVLTALLVVGPQFMVSGMVAGLPQAAQPEHQAHHHAGQAEHQHGQRAEHHHGARGECCDSCAACPVCFSVPGLIAAATPVAADRPGLPDRDVPVASPFHNTHRLPFPNGPPTLLA